MRVDLILDGVTVTIEPGEVIALTTQAAKFNTISNRSGNFSNTIKLPITTEIMTLYGHPDEVGSLAAEPYRRVPYEMRVGGVPISYGFAELEMLSDTVEVVLFSGLPDFLEQLGDMTTADINISDLNHRWNLTNIDNLRNKTADEGGVVYPDINYRRLHVTTPGVTSADWLPAVYPWRFLKDAADGIGWTVEGFDKTWVWPFSKKDFIGKDVTLAKVERTSDISYTNQQFYTASFNNVVNDFWTVFGTSGGFFGMQANYNGRYDFKLQLILDITVNAPSILAVYLTDGINFELIDQINIVSTLAIQGDYDVSYEFVSSTGNVTAAHVANVRLFFEIIGATSNNAVILKDGSFWEVVAHDGKTLGAPPSTYATGGGVVDCNSLFDPVKITDIIFWNAIRTNSVIIADSENRVLRYVALNDIAAAAPQDWTAYFDTTEKPEIQFRLSDQYAQSNIFGYLPDPENDPFKNRYEQTEPGEVSIDDTRLEATTEAVKPFFHRTYFLFFGNTVTGLSQFSLLPSILRYSNPASSFLSPDIDPGQRMGRIEIISSRAKFIPDDWKNLLIPQHYGALTGMLNRSKVIKAAVWLPLEEYLQVDITRPVLLLGQLWYIRKINQFKVNESDPVEVELIRL